ncbi:hypothetical protein PGT21_032494 [Puccinia graminis f. sp. tritici]|uniref:Uncharacterized protein n=1 Tax=Puccinia graminis f. sp. tritici TaxID=56615 RepID=A0A5B0PVP3_PUCGR|nr:hypothetical protein PGTUg99_015992 [Puccinia graminis f. sp. tritici]KAA1104828.1 hypothetical protein PGT21_032494 [Puccinia graminis f. sp. tritici]
MRCRYFAGNADIIGRHRLNLPPEPPDMRRDSGGFVVSLCPEFTVTQGQVTPTPSATPSNDETALKRRRHPILTNSTATRTQIQFVNSIHLAWNRSIGIESDELPSTVVHCHQDSTVIKQTKRLVSLTLRNPTPSLVVCTDQAKSCWTTRFTAIASPLSSKGTHQSKETQKHQAPKNNQP